MKQLVVVSGKGGTGKTTIVGSFAALAERPVLADCDVDAADLHLLLEPDIKEESDFAGPLNPVIDGDLCTGCGVCVEHCAFDALSLDDGVAVLDSIACEGCGLCARVCPVGAIGLHPVIAGRWFVSRTRFGPLVHARLGVAQENSGKLVTLVRNRAAQIAEQQGAYWLLVDGAPGIGCPVIASLAGADCVLIVTEPTLSGKSDMGRVARLAAHFGIRTLVCVNKWDINEAVTAEIEAEAKAGGCRIVGRVPYDPAVPRSIVEGVPLVEHGSGPAAQAVRGLWDEVGDALEIADQETRED